MLRSPPSRRRGLKYWKNNNHHAHISRLLRGGVDWNANQHHWKHPYLVASFAEAWIEIVCQPYNYLVRLLSPPSRRRGLKLLSGCLPRIGPWVASFAEAWIEILLSSSRLCRCIPSPPSRRRGLKFFLPPLLRWYSLSPPSRRRGLKYSVTPEKLLTVVASFAEAWIEISGVDSPFKGMKCRLLRGGVDWNGNALVYGNARVYVASFAEAWIEIVSPSTEDKEEKSPPSRRRGLKWLSTISTTISTVRRLLRGGVDWNIAC